MIIPIEKSLAYCFPELAKEWHKELNGSLTPEVITKRSGIKVWWKCSKNALHPPWEARPHDRTGSKKKKGTGCPKCHQERPIKGFREVSFKESLACLSPEIAKEWHPSLNENYIRPSNISNGSSKEVWWQCSTFEEHHWKCRLKDRTRKDILRRTNCPKCNNQSSIPEMRILSELESIFKKVISRKKLHKTEIDIFLPELSIGIEYDGYFYHSQKFDEDFEKNQKLSNLGVELLRIRERGLKETCSKDIFVDESITKSNLNQLIIEIFKIKKIENNFLLITKHDYLKSKVFLNDQLFKKYISYFPSPLPQNSLEILFPEISKEWSFNKNYPLTPRNFTPGSNHKVWWQCSKDKSHQWESAIKERTRKEKRGCAICAGKIVILENSLLIKSPDIAKEWHPSLNGNLTASQITNKSSKIIWWKCAKNKSHIWKCSVKDRTRNDSRRRICSECRKNNLNEK